MASFRSTAKCIHHLLSLEDSSRTRAASLKLLQDWMPPRCAQYQDAIAEAELLAGDVGGALRAVSLKWKYRPIEWLLGFERAVMASRFLPRVRKKTLREWDRLLFRLSSARRRSQVPPTFGG